VPLPAPKPVDALRQHTRAVVLISADGDASPALLDSIRDSEVPCELIGHPVVAMAELVRLEHGDRRREERTALFVADDERIEQLASLFQAVRMRLPQVAIWVIAGDLAVQVQRATVVDAAAESRFGSAGPSSNGISGTASNDARTAPRPGTPKLRIVEHDADAEAETAADDQHRDQLDNADADARDPEPDEIASASRATSLTAEELDMLLGWEDGDDTAPAPKGGLR
jgi:hypothetical protein